MLLPSSPFSHFHLCALSRPLLYTFLTLSRWRSLSVPPATSKTTLRPLSRVCADFRSPRFRVKHYCVRALPSPLLYTFILYLWIHFASLFMAACMSSRCMSVCREDFPAGLLVHMGPFDLTVLDSINNILYHQHIVRQDKVQTSSCMVTLTSYVMMS